MTKRHPIAVAGIQARMSSSRLPGKSLADLDGKPLIQRVWERVRLAARVDPVVVLTSSEPSDDELAAYCEEHGCLVRRGPLDDVMARYLALLEEFPRRWFVRVTGDCPFVDPRFIDLQLEGLEAHDGDWTLPADSAPAAALAGQGALSARALWQASASTDARDREHVGSFWLAENRAQLRAVELELDPLYLGDGPRLAVDEPADLELARRIYAALSPGWDSAIPLDDVLRWLEDTGASAHNAQVVESADNRAAQALRAARPPRIVGRHP